MTKNGFDIKTHIDQVGRLSNWRVLLLGHVARKIEKVHSIFLNFYLRAAQTAYLVLDETQGCTWQKLKSQILVRAQITASLILLYLPIFVKTILL